MPGRWGPLAGPQRVGRRGVKALWPRCSGNWQGRAVEIASPLMPPLPDAMVAMLKADACAALAAIMIIANAHSELLAWAQRTLSPLRNDSAPTQKSASETNGGKKASAEISAPGQKADTEVRKANGAGGTSLHAAKKFRAKGRPNSREAAAEHDQALLALMRANPDASVTELIRMSGRPRNSTVLSLERLEKAGLVEHAARGKWTVADLLEVPAPKPAGWIEPMSGARVARHAADGRVRDELTMAAKARNETCAAYGFRLLAAGPKPSTSRPASINRRIASARLSRRCAQRKSSICSRSSLGTLTARRSGLALTRSAA